MKKVILLLLIICLSGAAQTLFAQSNISEAATTLLINNKAAATGITGICIYDVEKQEYLYNYNADKYFVPASNMKIFSLYAGLKYLGDSIPSAKVFTSGNSITVWPAGDPTFLSAEFWHQPLFDTLRQTTKLIQIATSHWQENELGKGWTWDDALDDYSAARSLMPVNGNIVTITQNGKKTIPAFFADSVIQNVKGMRVDIDRIPGHTGFYISAGAPAGKNYSIPFSTQNGKTNMAILQSLLQKTVTETNLQNIPANAATIYSTTTDTLFKLMMHRSDNFFAEQTLLMVAEQKLGSMNDAAIIENLLTTDLKDMPQKPQWVDGSGLSRYNLSTPQNFVYLLKKIEDEFGFAKVQQIFATGGKGTLANHYQQYAGSFYAKTGTLSNNTALSGYLYTRQGKRFIFSLLANNYITSGTPVKRGFEDFLDWVIANN